MYRRRNLALLFVSLVLPAAYCQTTDPCVPDCTNSVPGGKVPDPYDCTRFYVCSADGTPSDTSLPCDGSGFIAPGGTDCDDTSCHQICGKCHLTCTAAGNLVADPFDCSVFYECSIAGPGIPQTCKSPYPYFDSINQICSDDATVCCKPGCNPYCEPDSVQVPDPTDCTKYYMCTSDPPYPHFSCDPGQTFNYGTGYCENGGECKELCSGGPITTTTPVNPGSTTTPVNPPTTTTIPEIGCITSFVCPGNGFFAKCNYCDPAYYFCAEPGANGVEERCTGGLVFNPVPVYPYCLRPEDCPHTPFH